MSSKNSYRNSKKPNLDDEQTVKDNGDAPTEKDNAATYKGNAGTYKGVITHACIDGKGTTPRFS